MKMRTQTEVLAWIKKFLPDLAPLAEADRHWIWLAADLRGDKNNFKRELIKEFGFRFKESGEHRLPSGRMARWAHHCEHPIARRPNNGHGGGPRNQPQPQPRRESPAITVERAPPAITVERAPLKRFDPFTDQASELAPNKTDEMETLEALIRAELGIK